MTETIDPICQGGCIGQHLQGGPDTGLFRPLLMEAPREQRGGEDTSLGCHDCSHVIVGQVQSFFTHLL